MPARPSYDRFAAVALSLAGAIAILYGTSRFGAGLSPDSVGYIAAARHIASGNGAVSFDGTPLVVQPPLYPVILAAISVTLGIDPVGSSRVLNALFFALIIVWSWHLLRRHTQRSSAVTTAAIPFVLLAEPLVRSSLMAWTEPLFVLLTLIHFDALDRYFDEGRGGSFVVLTLAAAAACMTRYVGVVLVGTTAIVLAAWRRTSLSASISRAGAFVASATLPLGLWLVRNRAVSGTWFGPRAPSLATLDQNVYYVTRTVMECVLPTTIGAPLYRHPSLVIAAGGLTALALTGAVYRLRKESTAPGVFPLSWFTIGYLAFLVLSATMVKYDRINDRLIAPVVVPLTVVLAWLARGALRRMSSRPLSRSHRIRAVALIAFLMWIAHPLRASLQPLRMMHEDGFIYTSRAWRTSATIAYLRSHAADSPPLVFSNSPEAVYILAGLSARLTPIHIDRRSTSDEATRDAFGTTTFPELADWSPAHGSWLVWFDRSERRNLVPLERLRERAHLRQRARLRDGTVYVVGDG